MFWHKAAVVLVKREIVCGQLSLRNTYRRAIRSWYKKSIAEWETLTIGVIQFVKMRRKRCILLNWHTTMTHIRSNREKAQATEHSRSTVLSKNILNKKRFHMNTWKKVYNVANLGIKVQDLHSKYVERKIFSLWVCALADLRINLKVHQIKVMASMKRDLVCWRKKVRFLFYFSIFIFYFLFLFFFKFIYLSQGAVMFIESVHLDNLLL